MRSKKKILFPVLIGIILIAFFSIGLFIWRERHSPKIIDLDSDLMRALLESPVAGKESNLTREFSGSPAVTGEFLEIDTERNLLSIQTYDPDLREDIIFTVEITDNTIFARETATDDKEKLYTKKEFYLDVLSNVYRGAYFRVTTDDIEKKPPEAFVVRVVDFDTVEFMPLEPETL